MARLFRSLIVVLVVLVCEMVQSGTAFAGNQQTGDNSSDTDQGGESASGDAIAGQVTGTVSAGETSVDATNRSLDVDVESGDAEGSNNATAQTGQFDSGVVDETVVDLSGVVGTNIQDGDNTNDISQAANTSTGDAVGGQVIGVVTSSGGNADVVASNDSEDVDASTGDADAANVFNPETEATIPFFTGQINGGVLAVEAAELSGTAAANLQNGDNSNDASQIANAATGDAVGGQVLGVVSGGEGSVDATNRSNDVDVSSGDSSASSDASTLTGQLNLGVVAVGADDLSGVVAGNLQDGDNSSEIFQTANASTGDAVGGQVIGVVTSSGGSADIVAANDSKDIDASTGDADATAVANPLPEGLTAFMSGQFNAAALGVSAGEFSGTVAANLHNGDNASEITQASDATTGDAVGGQVIGVVSAGDASVDATNRSNDVDVGSGDSSASSEASTFSGQLNLGIVAVDAIDLSGMAAANLQDGDNTNDVSQAADANTGDAVGGQVVGVVTSFRGSADIVAANDSEDIDAETGDADADALANAEEGVDPLFTGQENVAVLDVSAGELSGTAAANLQNGDNSNEVAQASDATTGDAVGGQVLGVVSAGDASVDATNRSNEVDVISGDSSASSSTLSFTGQINVGVVAGEIGDLSGTVAGNLQNGDNSNDVSQAANANTGDAVGGQVIGVVTALGGSADVVAANDSEDIDAETGQADATAVANPETEDIPLFTGQINAAALGVQAAELSGTLAANLQDGDNSREITQASDATTGDGVGGQVLGVVSAGDSSVDATNRSNEVDVSSGDSSASTDASASAGQLNVGVVVGTDDLSGTVAGNLQNGDNSIDVSQAANANTGDAVGGQVLGVVTALGGSADVVAANDSEDIDGKSGDSTFTNSTDSFVGQNPASLIT